MSAEILSSAFADTGSVGGRGQYRLLRETDVCAHNDRQSGTFRMKLSAGTGLVGGSTMTAQVVWHDPDSRPADSRRRYQWSGLILLAPAVVLTVVFFVFPVVYAAMIGFTNLSLVGPNAVHYSFTGL